MQWIRLGTMLIVAVFVSCVPAGWSWAAEPVVHVTGEETSVSLLPRKVLLDEAGSLTPAQAASRLQAADVEIETGLFSRGYTGDTLWARIVLEIDEAAAGRWYLSLQLPNFDRLQVFTVPDGHQPIPLVELGDRVPTVTDIRTRFHIAPIDLEPGRLVLLAKGRTGSTLTLDLKLRKLDTMLESEQDFFALQTFYIGVASVFGLGAIFLFFYTGQPIHLIYVINLVAHLGIWLLINGTGPGHLWPDIADRFHIDPHFFVAMSIAATGAFSAIFLSGVRVPVLARRSLWGIAVIGLVLMVITLITPERHTYFSSALVSTFVLPGACIMIVLTAIGLVRGEPAARPLMLTWIGLIAAVILATLRDVGAIPSNAFTLTGAQLGSVFEMIVFAYMLLDRLGRVQREKEALQAEALAAARQQEVLLERRVLDRTAELDATLERERKARQLQQHFVSMVSHEFRTPLAVLDAAAHNIVPRHSADRDRLHTIHDAVRRLSGMIDVCLIDDRVQDGKIHLETEHLEICEVIENVVDILEAEAREHSFEMVWPDDPVFVMADPRLIEVAFNNVLENAVKYSPTGSKIEVSVVTADAMIQIAVDDQGPGVPPEDRDRIFDRFYRAGEPSSTKGVGLGLFLVRSILGAHDGTIRCGANPSGKGSRFLIELPVSDLPESAAA